MQRSRVVWTLAITSIALFMVVLDNLVVSTALPVIRVNLDASIQELEWTVNVAVLASTFAQTGGYATPETFVEGVVPATFVGAAVVAVGALAALAVPPLRRPGSIRSNPQPAAAA